MDERPNDTWGSAVEYYDERARRALVLHIALTNVFNRLSVATRQPARDW